MLHSFALVCNKFKRLFQLTQSNTSRYSLAVERVLNFPVIFKLLLQSNLDFAMILFDYVIAWLVARSSRSYDESLLDV